jgi:hypothetical protein
MVRRRAVSNHEATMGLILRDAAKAPLLRMRTWITRYFNPTVAETS